MLTPWKNSVKKRKQLTVFPTKQVTKGPWYKVFQDALNDFNRLSSLHKLGVTLTETATPPDSEDADSPKGANVQFDIAPGKKYGFRAHGRDFEFAITGLDGGHTRPIQFTPNGRMLQAFIFLPASIQADDSPPPVREAGDKFKVALVVHEFIHACGLHGAEHSPGGADADVFFSPLNLLKDKDAHNDVAVADRKKLDPISLNLLTIFRIRACWE